VNRKMNSKVNSKEKKIKARLVVFQASLKGRREPGYQPVDVSSPAFVISAESLLIRAM